MITGFSIGCLVCAALVEENTSHVIMNLKPKKTVNIPLLCKFCRNTVKNPQTDIICVDHQPDSEAHRHWCKAPQLRILSLHWQQYQQPADLKSSMCGHRSLFSNAGLLPGHWWSHLPALWAADMMFYIHRPFKSTNFPLWRTMIGYNIYTRVICVMKCELWVFAFDFRYLNSPQ